MKALPGVLRIIGCLLFSWWIWFVVFLGIDDIISDYLENNNGRTDYIIHSPAMYLPLITVWIPIAAFVLTTWTAIARITWWSFARVAVLLIIYSEWAYLGGFLPTQIHRFMAESQSGPGAPGYFYGLQPRDYMASVVRSILGIIVVLLGTFGIQKLLLNRKKSGAAKTTAASGE